MLYFRCELTQMPDSISDCGSLETIQLYNTGTRSFPSLVNCTKLTELALYHVPLLNPPAGILMCQNLTKLSLDGKLLKCTFCERVWVCVCVCVYVKVMSVLCI